MKTVGFALVALSSVAHGALTGMHKSNSGRGPTVQPAPEPEPKRSLQDMSPMVSMLLSSCSQAATLYQGMPASSDAICAMSAPYAASTYTSPYGCPGLKTTAVFNGVTTCSAFGAAYATFCGQLVTCLTPKAAPTTKASLAVTVPKAMSPMVSALLSSCSQGATLYQGMPASSDAMCAMSAPYTATTYTSLPPPYGCPGLKTTAVFNGVTTCSAFGAAYATFCGQLVTCLTPKAAPTSKAPLAATKANIKVDFTVTVPAGTTGATSAAKLQVALKSPYANSAAEKIAWANSVVTEIKAASPTTYANVAVETKSVVHVAVTTIAAPNSQARKGTANGSVAIGANIATGMWVPLLVMMATGLADMALWDSMRTSA